MRATAGAEQPAGYGGNRVGTPVWQRLVVVALSGIVTFGASAVTLPSPALRAATSATEAPRPAGAPLAALAAAQPGEDPPLVDADPVEVPEMRTADSRTVRNADGTYTTEYFADAVHFLDGSGDWRPIEAVPVASDEQGKAFETKRGPVMVRFAASSLVGDLVTVTGAEDSVKYRATLPVPLDGAPLPNDVTPVSDGTHVTYPVCTTGSTSATRCWLTA